MSWQHKKSSYDETAIVYSRDRICLIYVQAVVTKASRCLAVTRWQSSIQDFPEQVHIKLDKYLQTVLFTWVILDLLFQAQPRLDSNVERDMASSTLDDTSLESRMADSNETDRDSLDDDAEDGPQAELIGTVELSFASSTRQRQWTLNPPQVIHCYILSSFC